MASNNWWPKGLSKLRLVYVLTLWLKVVRCGWQDNLLPRVYIQPREKLDYTLFAGNITQSNHFSVLLVDGDHILLGGRNVVYKLGINDLRVRQTLHWSSGEHDRGFCTLKGKSEEHCQNYIKVLKKFDNDVGRYLVCGTNAFKPVCREYVEDLGDFLMRNQTKGLGMCPYSPLHNSTAVLVGDQLYAGTAADYQGVDPILYRDPLRTPQFDTTYLNNPSFVGSFATEHHVYFFFREGAVEYMNCGKSVFSRVARVCKNDLGGTRSLNAKWTSFLKARLNCSVSGNYPFYFDEIQDVTTVVEGMYGDERKKIIYAVFSTPPNSIGGSAVCAFSMDSVDEVFEGQFKEQRSPSDNWLAVDPHRVPSPRPGRCSNNSKDLPDENLNFIKTHPLMNDAVPAFFGSPVLIHTGLHTSFTAVAVDPQVVTTDGSLFDVVFVGTSSGRLLKSVNSLGPKSVSSTKPVLVEEIEAMNGPIRLVKVVNRRKGYGQVMVVSSQEVRSFPLYRCEKATTCSECVALQDPYCAWDVRGEVCRGALAWAKGSHKSYLQAVVGGSHSSCPSSDPVPTPPSPHKHKLSSGTVINQIQYSDTKRGRSSGETFVYHQEGGSAEVDQPDKQATPVLFTLETLIITVSAGAVAALVLGFVTGYCCGRKCGKDETNVPYPEYEYFEQRQLPPRPLPAGPHALQPLLQQTEYKQQPEETLYAEPILINNPVKPTNPLGTTLAHKPYPSSGLSLMGGGVHTGQNNKFNTISNVHKRSQQGISGHYGVSRVGLLHSASSEDGNKGPHPGVGGPEINHYERAGLPTQHQLLLRSGGGALPPASVYHMGTLSRASKLNKETLGSNPGGNSPVAVTTSGGVGVGMSSQPQQVVDSAYGTTRSVKKVYL